MDVKIIDNALPVQTFELVKRNLFFNSQLNLHVQSEVSGHGVDDENNLDNWCLYHSFYNEGKPNNDEFYDLLNIFGKYLTFNLNGKTYSHKAIIRIKANCYPSTHTIIHHNNHQDYPFPHKGAIFYLNTNNGLTILDDTHEIKSVENRLLIFDSSKIHRSTTCTDDKVRMNVNFNYFS